MEGVKEIMENLQSSQATSRKFEFTGRAECWECKKVFEYDKGKYPYDDRPKTCSKKCEEIIEKELLRQAFIETVPPKFIEIETNKKELLEKLYGKSVFISGGVGVGKTVLVSSLVKKYIYDRRKVKWINYPAFIMKLQNAYKKNGEETPFDMAQEVAGCGILVIDDIGVSKATDFVRQITYFIVNYREQCLLTTLITSNYSLEQLDEYIDDRVSSRIVGMCECIILRGSDRRLQKGGVK